MWYLFTKYKMAQSLLVTSFILSTVGSVAALALAFPTLHSNIVHLPLGLGYYCEDPAPSGFWIVFVPSFMLHGILSIFMVLRVIHNVRISKDIPFSKRVLRE